MTVTYTAEVASCKQFGCFLKLLFRWRGSIYKLVWTDLVTFLAVYYMLNMIYRFALTDDQKRIFENVVHYCQSYSSLIPLSFVLGFFVQIVMQRWWEQYIAIPWPDPVAVFVSAHIHGEDDRARLMRRTIMRYVCLCQAIVFSMISPKVKKRFPTYSHLVDAGLMLDNEKVVFDSMNESFPKVAKHWMPIVWATSIVTRARKEGLIRDDFAVKTIVDELNKFRGQCGTLLVYDYITIPLVYTQVVTIAVYTFFLSSVIGQQWTEKSLTDAQHKNNIDFYVPIFTTLQFFFYMGWLKVAESLINPFGEDDDDFEVSWMIDRNLQVSYLIVDEMHQDHPDLVKDQYWDEVFPSELPYDGEVKREEPPEPSTAKLGERLATMSTIRIDKSVTRPSNIQVSASLSGESERFERRSVFLRRNVSAASNSEPGYASVYETAVATPLSGLKSPPEQRSKTSSVEKIPKVVELTIPEAELARPEEPEKPRRLITEGLFESSDESVFNNIAGSLESLDQGEEEQEQDHEHDHEHEKDDFEKLKEERERERTERQRLRFVQHLEDATQLKVERDSVPHSQRDSDIGIEEYDSVDEHSDKKGDKKKATENKDKPDDEKS